MKKFALLSFLFIVIASAEVRFCKAGASPDAVLDVNGEKLRAGVNYSILPYFRRNAGGLTIGSIRKGHDRCPVLNIVPGLYESYDGLPATFSPINPKKGVVRVSTDLNIQFQANGKCGKSTVWKVAKLDQSTGQYFVTIGGTKGNPGRETLDSWFKIEKLRQNYYKLVYCPTSVCKYCKVTCKDVGIFYGNGKMALVLNDAPYPVMFKKLLG